MLRPRKVALCHHDNWMPPFTFPTDVEPVKHELARVASGVEFIEMPISPPMQSSVDAAISLAEKALGPSLVAATIMPRAYSSSRRLCGMCNACAESARLSDC
jgi:hypothetical protein